MSEHAHGPTTLPTPTLTTSQLTFLAKAHPVGEQTTRAVLSELHIRRMCCSRVDLMHAGARCGACMSRENAAAKCMQ